MNSIGSLGDLHTRCSCMFRRTVDGAVSKHSCRLKIDGLQIAMDCDDCRAFGKESTKPDIIGVQRCDSPNDNRWLVVEIKGVMDNDAREQVEAGLQKIAQHDLFRVDIKRARVCFAFTQRDLRRTADRSRLRKPLKFRGTSVPVLVTRCGRTIPRQWRQ